MEEKKEKISFQRILTLEYKADLDVKHEKEVPNFSEAKMFFCVKKKKKKKKQEDSLLENSESYPGQFTSLEFLFCLIFGQFFKKDPERS